MLIRDRLSKYGGVVVAILITNLLTILGTYAYVLKQDLSVEVSELRGNLETISEEVTINSSLRNREEVRMSVVRALKELSARSGNKLSIEQVAEIAGVIMEKYQLHDIKPSLAISIISTESSFNPVAVSSANAKGLMQVMDSTARPYLTSYGIAWDRDVLFDPVINVRVALDYLQNLHEIHVAEGLEHDDDYTVSLLRYNRSQPAMDKLLEDPLGLQYTAKINQIQSEIRKSGVL
ncbi:MAG TPA: lytic transglycosylase domain-containing protein [Candidatus Paceibacterota bacterium]|nr:lytic transglycosylase domain-containing protein [Candidatus Paceibacterota bacterium]